MSKLIIEGGTALNGSIKVSGNKNAALPMIAACLLTDKAITLHNLPDILDVKHMLEALQSLGASIERHADSVTIHAKDLSKSSLDHETCSKIRTSILLVAPILYRTGKVELHPPGGDVIGRRRLDTHFYGLEKLGAKLTDSFPAFVFEAKDGFSGSDLFFDQASVTATEHILMAAVVAKGKTWIRNAASEPHVQNLAEMLINMGARIKGLGTNCLEIDGVSSLDGGDIHIGGDYIEAASFLALGAATGGEITVTGTNKSDFWMARRVFERLGILLNMEHSQISIDPNSPRKIQADFGGAIPVIDDGPWPQFPSDMMSCMIVLASQVEGTVLFFEKMFESRLYFVDRLISMGANAIVCDPHRVVISGPAKLRANTLSSPDIRAGMALLGGALCASGTSTVKNIQMIDRGYANIESRLLQLGARVQRVN
ncbi:UDP-N-acetylglucosamine 1-carboxyvinyltransferase [Lentisphaera araneosa HTCC2155]|uniref:UDP-N-acetylglucosamine 1-carboxyvinyltransferase n=1 Tax=Lentisphaera araneosa HTCC2155 TaxID=313628 RepID=A6DIQ8_9BACT|nr:UDP-N-acetylglucosamine 1-carboxyvinyltransferase [Lentisphaera araneosa]EDM28344.1 UDP-N-acetylglucosamine 1-carboxyvinyltransferase [Lentisphaera araneosa HTCC2155]